MAEDTLTNGQIAILCDIGQASADHHDNDRQREVAELVAEGYLRPAKDDAFSRYELTDKAQDFLAESGAGLNEA